MKNSKKIKIGITIIIFVICIVYIANFGYKKYSIYTGGIPKYQVNEESFLKAKDNAPGVWKKEGYGETYEYVTNKKTNYSLFANNDNQYKGILLKINKVDKNNSERLIGIGNVPVEVVHYSDYNTYTVPSKSFTNEPVFNILTKVGICKKVDKSCLESVDSLVNKEDKATFDVEEYLKKENLYDPVVEAINFLQLDDKFNFNNFYKKNNASTMKYQLPKQDEGYEKIADDDDDNVIPKDDVTEEEFFQEDKYGYWWNPVPGSSKATNGYVYALKDDDGFEEYSMMAYDNSTYKGIEIQLPNQVGGERIIGIGNVPLSLITTDNVPLAIPSASVIDQNTFNLIFPYGEFTGCKSTDTECISKVVEKAEKDGKDNYNIEYNLKRTYLYDGFVKAINYLQLNSKTLKYGDF